ncbi:MAG TPA: ribosome recycling factor [Thermodesulfobacteriota bacterium]|nr:ribosome recycling factor [Thermodesulfobacteriota bacterium]
MVTDVIAELKTACDKAIEALRREFATVRTGRASLSLLEHVRVDYYGSQLPVNQVATMRVADPRLIVIEPWDVRAIPEIEKAILKSGLGLTPSNDGKVIRLPVPPLTEERRRELVKVLHKMAETGRIAIRNARHEALDSLKELEREKLISEDDHRRGRDEVQKVVDAYTARVGDLLAAKEKELLEV